MLCKHGDGRWHKRTVKGRCVLGSLARFMRRNASIEVERSLRNSILLQTLTNGSDPLTWNRAHQSRVYSVEIIYLREACGVTRWEGESKESLHERCDTEIRANGVKYGVMDWVKRNTLRWFDEREKNGEFVKKVYASETEGPRRRGRSAVRWKDRVMEYMHESYWWRVRV